MRHSNFCFEALIKALLKTFTVTFFCTFIHLPAFANGILARAYEQYSQRDFTEAGVKNAENSRYNYNSVITKLEADEGQYARARALQASFFIIQASQKNRKFNTQQGLSEAAQAQIYFERKYGRNPLSNNSMSAFSRKIYADVSYWGALMSYEWFKDQGGSFGNEFRKLENNMKAIIQSGFGCLNDGGAYYFLGIRSTDDGNLTTAADYFKSALTCAPWNGWNILAYAKLKGAPSAEAITLLKDFLKKSPDELSVEFKVENRKAQEEAKALLLEWGQQPTPQRVPNEYLVKLKPNVRIFSPFLAAAHDQRVQYAEALFKVDVLSTTDDDLFLVKIDSDKKLTQLQSNPLVEVIEPNWIYSVSSIPNDPLFPQSWGLHNTGQDDPKEVPGFKGIDIGAVKAWEKFPLNRTTLVGVVDTGIDFTHPDLIESMWMNEAERLGQPGVDDDQNGYIDDLNGWDFVANTAHQKDDHGHGTHCAGVIAATNNNSLGIAGINSNAKLIALKFLGEHGSGTLDGAVKAIRYANKVKAQVTNNSWGGGPYSEILKSVIQEANSLGYLFVAAAGNSGANTDVAPEYPANYDLENVISVAAINNRGELSNFSNYGTKSVHVAAPGQNIISTLPGNRYESLSGTSMAAPHVSGVASLLLSHESLNPTQVKERLINTAAKLNSLTTKIKSGGTTHLFNALTNLTSDMDPYDPNKWNQEPMNVETAHPYSADQRIDYVVNKSGVDFISIYFTKVSLEKYYDKLIFLDENNKIVTMWTGEHQNEWSPIINSSKVTLRLLTDNLTQDFGFSTKAFAYKKEIK